MLLLPARNENAGETIILRRVSRGILPLAAKRDGARPRRSTSPGPFLFVSADTCSVFWRSRKAAVAEWRNSLRCLQNPGHDIARAHVYAMTIGIDARCRRLSRAVCRRIQRLSEEN